MTKRGFFASEAGQSLVETALFAPLLLAVTFGIIEVSRYEHLAIQVDNAARAGVQYGAQNATTAGSNSSIDSAALGDSNMTQCSDTVTTNCLTLTPSMYCICSNGTGKTGAGCATPPLCSGLSLVRYSTLEVVGTFHSLFHYPGIPTSITVTRTAYMRVN